MREDRKPVGSVRKADVISAASHAAFGKPRVTNVLRAILVEAAIHLALPPEWKWCSADYFSFDFQHVDGSRLEVKQSAALQSWAASKPSRPVFDIAPRTGAWTDEAKWIPGVGRNTDIYVFAHHPIVDPELADHRDPHQWTYYILEAKALPVAEQKTIGLGPLISLGAQACSYASLARSVEIARLQRVV